MITYKLAKKLKDAGFPTIKLTDHIPTLSELIEACGDRFSTLEQDRFSTLEQMTGDACEYDWVKEEGAWHAEYSIGIIPQECASGFTPEEAVANLWLKLNEKNGTRNN